MKWEVVKIQANEKSASRRSEAYASIGFGRISINTSACSLIGDYDEYKYAEFLRGRQNNKLCIGVRFLREDERTPFAMPLRRRLRNGIPTGGVDIHGKKVLEDLFGPVASASKTTRFSVVKDNDSENIIIIFAE